PRDKAVRGDKGVMMCLDEKTGEFLWQITHDRLPSQLNYTAKEGLMSAPCVEGDNLYYVSNRAEVVCASIKGKGKVLWTYDMIKELKVFVGQHMYSSPLVLGDLVYAVTCNGVSTATGKLPSPKAPALIAVDKAKGTLVWRCDLPGNKVMR